MKSSFTNPGSLKIADLKYLSKKLSTSTEIIRKLTEDDHDLNLILDRASITDIKREDSRVVSPLVYIKLLVFRYSQDTGFDMGEKNYISNCVFDHFLEISKNIDYLLLCSKTPPSEAKSRYFLVLSGFHYDRVHPKLLFPGFETVISDGFRKNDKLRILAGHTKSWIEISREIKRKQWLENGGVLLLTDKA